MRPGGEGRRLMRWAEGNGGVVFHLYNKVKAKVRLGLAVCEIVPGDAPGRAGVDVIAIDHDGQTASGFHADNVIFAAPHFLTNYVIRPYRENPPPHVAEVQYGACMF